MTDERFLRTTLPMNRAMPVSALRVGIVSALMLLAGCKQPYEASYGAYFDHPQDAEVNIYAMERCLSAGKGPSRTQYNDWDEAIKACTRFADDASRYCPDADMGKCLTQYRRSRESVRLALPAKAIEARSEKTGTGLAVGESADPQGFVQPTTGATP